MQRVTFSDLISLGFVDGQPLSVVTHSYKDVLVDQLLKKPSLYIYSKAATLS